MIDTLPGVITKHCISVPDEVSVWYNSLYLLSLITIDYLDVFREPAKGMTNTVQRILMKAALLAI